MTTIDQEIARTPFAYIYSAPGRKFIGSTIDGRLGEYSRDTGEVDWATPEESDAFRESSPQVLYVVPMKGAPIDMPIDLKYLLVEAGGNPTPERLIEIALEADRIVKVTGYDLDYGQKLLLLDPPAGFIRNPAYNPDLRCITAPCPGAEPFIRDPSLPPADYNDFPILGGSTSPSGRVRYPGPDGWIYQDGGGDDPPTNGGHGNGGNGGSGPRKSNALFWLIAGALVVAALNN